MRNVFCRLGIGLLALVGAVSAARGEGPVAELVESKKIWDLAPHNAFTDLIRFQDRWYCVFREGKAHVSPDGALRIITSPDGKSWNSAALIQSENSDLRDAKINLTPDGKLMLGGAAALHQPQGFTHQSLVWFSPDGHTWSAPTEVADPNYWMWRITWHKQVAYGVGYECGKTQDVRLYRSTDGKRFETLVSKLYDTGYPNESSLVFQEDDTCLCLLRRDGKPNSGLLGTARPPYVDWSWKDLGIRIGGPHLLHIPDGRLIAAVRLYEPKPRTALCTLDAKAGKIHEILALPSGGDTSYAGLVWHEGLLWVSYYSSHEGKTCIYLAKVRFPPQG